MSLFITNDQRRLFDTSYIGFASLFEGKVENTKYPPYDILTFKTTHMTAIQVAVAGFKREELNVTVENSTLTITGSKLEEENSETSIVDYQYKGIASRSFGLDFKLAPNVEVRYSKLEDGILHVVLNRVPPKDDSVIQIEIK